jgi:hypothetical protein
MNQSFNFIRKFSTNQKKNNIMLDRNKKTLEVIVSKLVPAGCGWQAASIYASELQYDPTTYQFFATVGFGEGGAVLLGHTMYYTTKKIFVDKNISLKQEYSNGLQLGTAATLSGSIWQPTVNFLYNNGFSMTAIGTSIICGATFYGGLKLSRYLYSPFLLLDNNNKKNNINDFALSCSIAGAAGMFVATDVTLANNYLEFLFGINENMTDNHGIITAGSSTGFGFLIFQSLQNLKKRNWID